MYNSEFYSTSWFNFIKRGPRKNNLVRIIYLFRNNIIQSPFTNWYQWNMTVRRNLGFYVSVALKINWLIDWYFSSVRLRSYFYRTWIQKVSIDINRSMTTKEWVIHSWKLSTQFFLECQHMLLIYSSKLFVRNYFHLELFIFSLPWSRH